MAKKTSIPCVAIKSFGSLNSGDRFGASFRDYEAEMRKPEAQRRFRPDLAEEKPEAPKKPPVPVPKLEDLIAEGESEEIATGIVARQTALAAGKSVADADAAAAEATSELLAKRAEEKKAAKKAEREASTSKNREAKPSSNRSAG